jgi:hypothetical protein
MADYMDHSAKDNTLGSHDINPGTQLPTRSNEVGPA